MTIIESINPQGEFIIQKGSRLGRRKRVLTSIIGEHASEDIRMRILRYHEIGSELLKAREEESDVYAIVKDDGRLRRYFNMVPIATFNGEGERVEYSSLSKFDPRILVLGIQSLGTYPIREG